MHRSIRRSTIAVAALLGVAALTVTFATPASAASADNYLTPGASRNWLQGTDPAVVQSNAYGEHVRCADDARIIGSYPITAWVADPSADSGYSLKAVSWLNVRYSDTCSTNWFQVWNAYPAGYASFDIRYTTDLTANGFQGLGSYYKRTFTDTGMNWTSQVVAPRGVCTGFTVQAVTRDGSTTDIGQLRLDGLRQENGMYLIC